MERKPRTKVGSAYMNVFVDPYYVEDLELINMIEAFYEQHKEKTK